MPFEPEYVSHVLEVNFADAKRLFLAPLLAIHRAHLVMLADRGIVAPGHARAVRDGLDAIPENEVRAAPFDEACEDLFFHIEARLEATCGRDVAGWLRIARSRNDIDMTMYRMRQREWLLALVAQSVRLREALLALAGAHVQTLFAAHTHTQPAQPTTLAHYLLAVVEQVERDGVRLRAAWASVNRCPLGACAITGTGFPIDRQQTSDLLGFDGPTGNTYGSIATVDYLLESAAAVSVMLVGLGRVVQDLLLWSTAEVGYLRLADGLVQSSSIMPQKRNPVALEHTRSLISRACAEAAAIPQVVHNTPFGDIVDTEDDLQPLVASMFGNASRAVSLLVAVLRGAEFDVARMRDRAAAHGTTSTELADDLVRRHGLPFVAAHEIAATALAEAGGPAPALRAAAVARASVARIGRALQYSDADMERVMSAEHFVDVRRTPGGPAAEQTGRAIEAATRAVGDDRRWLAGTRDRLDEARRTLAERSQAL